MLQPPGQDRVSLTEKSDFFCCERCTLSTIYLMMKDQLAITCGVKSSRNRSKGTVAGQAGSATSPM